MDSSATLCQGVRLAHLRNLSGGINPLVKLLAHRYVEAAAKVRRGVYWSSSFHASNEHGVLLDYADIGIGCIFIKRGMSVR